MCKNIICIINSAATVKHLGDYSHFEKTNVLSVKNLIDVCKDIKDCQLVHISTLSVSGSTAKSGSYTFTEKDLFINQNIDDNIYIKTKITFSRARKGTSYNYIPFRQHYLENL